MQWQCCHLLYISRYILTNKIFCNSIFNVDVASIDISFKAFRTGHMQVLCCLSFILQKVQGTCHFVLPEKNDLKPKPFLLGHDLHKKTQRGEEFMRCPCSYEIIPKMGWSFNRNRGICLNYVWGAGPELKPNFTPHAAYYAITFVSARKR